MTSRNTSSRNQKKQNINAFFLLAFLICFIYSNTLNSSWHLDDEPNIVLNPYLHLTDLRPASLADTLISGSSWSKNPKLYRPVPSFTFALNWYFSQDQTTSYHVVNIAIHIITSFFLFLVIRQILQQVSGKDNRSRKDYFIALLSASLWAAAPIQTQAVTYIVQRMAAMAAMFSIFSIYCYVKGRTSPPKAGYWFTLCFLFFLAALGSKENTILLPTSLLLVEFSFFRHKFSKQRLIRIFAVGAFSLFVGFLFVYFALGLRPFTLSNPLQFLDSYAHRSFTFSERILTQPRIVLMYLSQILLPLVSRLSIVHDIALSTSLVTPWTTLPAILIILFILIITIFFLKKYPLFCFPIIFFFLNHGVESTILQLELIFEHRNYLPSFFLFLPVSFFISKAIYDTSEISCAGRAFIIISTVCFLVLSGHATYIRNLAWATEGTLWTDGIHKAPSSSRAANFLGRWFKKNGNYEQALYYYQRELQYSDISANPKESKLTALNSLGSIPYQFGRYDVALRYLDQCLIIDETYEDCLKNRAMSYIRLGLPEEALKDAQQLVDLYPSSPLYKYTAALAAYHGGDLTITYMQKAIKKLFDKPYALHFMGIILLRYNVYSNSLFFLKQAVKIAPNNIEYQLALAAAYHADGKTATSDAIINNLLNNYPLSTIQAAVLKTEQYAIDKPLLQYIVNTLNALISKSKTNTSLSHEKVL